MENAPRERIVDAAVALFWQQGYHAVSTGMLCKTAGVSKSSLYYVFGAKAEVLAAALDAVWTRNSAEIASIYERDAPMTDRFRAHLAWFHDSQRQLKDRFGRALGTFDMALGVSIPEDVGRTISAHQEVHAAIVEGALYEIIGGRTEQREFASWTAQIATNAITGATVRARVSDDLRPLKALPETIFRLIERASA